MDDRPKPDEGPVLAGSGGGSQASRIVGHYDFFTADPELFANFCDVSDVVVLQSGQSTDI